ncbi:MAG TPA: flavodoxin [Candidatus Nanoarchaeia archaeon]|nr:flavodoxin [Candidatus Nanoarchaeia archaeon]
MKSLVVYYSRTGNAKFVAQTVAAELGSDLEEIVDTKNRAGKLGWISASRDASGGKQTSISPMTRNPADYDLIIVGTPVWAWRPTPAIRTYFANNNLTGKKIALFFTMDSNPRQAAEKTKALAPGAVCVGELAIAKALDNKVEAEKKIADWCSTLKNA